MRNEEDLYPSTHFHLLFSSKIILKVIKIFEKMSESIDRTKRFFYEVRIVPAGMTRTTSFLLSEQTEFALPSCLGGGLEKITGPIITPWEMVNIDFASNLPIHL